MKRKKNATQSNQRSSMKKSSKKRVLCSMCQGSRTIKVKVKKKYRTIDLCPLCGGKGYLLIIKQGKAS